MTTPQKTIWKLEPHTKAKHEILRRYLGAWFPILNTHYGRIVYIDGFCGPGRYEEGEQGSPLIALSVAANHRNTLTGKIRLVFIDERKDRVDYLNTELNNISIPDHFKVETNCGIFQEKVWPVLNEIDRSSDKNPPIFAFVDPFGFAGIPFSIIENILKRPRAEALITFMVDSINRFLEHPDEIITQHIIEAYGCDEPLQIAKESGSRVSKLRALYQKKLEGIARFVRYFEMRDRNNRTQYYLFFATNHERGHLKMKEAMWKTDESGQFTFSDATDPGQIVLFESNPIPILAEKLLSNFQNKPNISGLQIRKFIENKTAFLKKHMTVLLKEMEAADKIIVSGNKSDGKKRRKGSYPDEAIISFKGIK